MNYFEVLEDLYKHQCEYLKAMHSRGGVTMAQVQQCGSFVQGAIYLVRQCELVEENKLNKFSSKTIDTWNRWAEKSRKHIKE